MSTPVSPDARYWADPSSRPTVLALLIVLVALTVALLLATGRDLRERRLAQRFRAFC